MSPWDFLTRAVKRSFNEFTANSTVHGLKYFSRKGWILRMLWTIIILFAILSAIFLVMVFWTNYLSNPTRIIVENRKLTLAEIPFPAVTVCGPRKLTSESIEKLLKNLTVPDGISVQELRSVMPKLSLFLETDSNLVHAEKLNILNEVFVFNNLSVDKAMRFMRPTCDEYILRCRWSGVPIKCAEIFTKALTVTGYCCSFNYKQFDRTSLNFTYKTTGHYGYKSGLTVIVSQKHKLPKFRALSTITDLFKVVIHNSESFAGLDAYSVAIEPGYEYFFGVQVSSISSANEVRKLQVQDRDCVFSDEVKLKYFSDYNNYDCQLERHIEALVNSCGCQTYVYPSNSDDIVCNVTRILCVNKFNAQDTSFERSLYHCPFLCDWTDLKVDYTFGVLSLDGSNIDEFYDNLSSDDAVIHVFYDTQYIFGKKRVMVHSWINLLSNFGGVFSLFLGCSFVSILEIAYFTFVRFPMNIAKEFKTEKGRTAILK